MSDIIFLAQVNLQMRAVPKWKAHIYTLEYDV